MRKISAIACLLALQLGSAAAADMIVKAPPASVPAPMTWAGWYIGAQGGYAWGQFSQTNRTSGVSLGYFDQHGALAGGTAGYNWQIGNWVFGVEGDDAWSNFSGHQSCGPLRDHTCTTRMDNFGTMRGRLGLAVFDTTLVYGTGGVAFGDVRATRDTGASEGAAWRSGPTFGGGIETMFMPHLSLKAEYLYSIFRGDATTYYIFPATPVSTIQRDVQMVRAGLNWHF